MSTDENMVRLARTAGPVQDALRKYATGLTSLAPLVQDLTDRFRAITNAPERVAAMEARYQITAGMDPAYAVDPDALIQDILTGEAGQLAFATPATRAKVAAAAIRGWSVSHTETGPGHPVFWHRAYGDTIIQVGAA